MNRPGIDWQARFLAGDTPWQRPGPNPAFEIWRDRGAFEGLATVLVPGAGCAPEPVAFARLGLHPTSVDIAPAAVAYQRDALARERLAGETVCADLLDWEPGRRFDAVYEQTAMCALPPERWEDYADRLFGWLRPGGRLFALFMQTGRPGGPPYHQDLTRMRGLFAPDRWRWPPESDILTAEHPAGLREIGVLLQRDGSG